MTSIHKDLIDIYFDYGVDKQNRRIFLYNDIDRESISIVIKGLYYMNAESKDKPIELFVGSLGGDEYDMWGLYDVIQTLEVPVHTIAIGCCMSASPLLVACGEPGHRFAMPHTWFMVHQSWDDFGEKRIDEIKKNLQHMTDMERMWCELMEKHTKQPFVFWKNQSTQVGDRFFTAKQAQKWGIIDHIIGEKNV